MVKLVECPLAERVVDDNGKCRPVWQTYFDNLAAGDVGTTWTPTINNLAFTGTPTITGVYYQNAGGTDWYVKIVPGTNTSSTQGSTAVVLPFSIAADTGAWVIAGASVSTGAVNASQKLCYLPSWTSLTQVITISGRVKS